MPPYLGNIILVEKMVRRPHGPLPYPDQYFIIPTIASFDRGYYILHSV